MSVNNKLIGTPFAENAGDTWKYSIPNALTSSDDPNKASYETGFPPVTMTPIEAGGIPFFGQDVNGILNDTTTAIRFMQTGDYQSYNSDFAKIIGGYPKDAQIKGSDGLIYICTADGNTSDPTGLDGWQTFLSSATDSESETQAATSLAVKQVNDLISTQNSGRLLNVIKITETSTYTPSKGTNFIIVEAVGGGGAGGGAYSNDVNSVALGAGGAGGAYCKSKLSTSSIGTEIEVTIGSGGVGISGKTGGSGGDTKFGSFLTAGGGKGGGMSGPSQATFLTASSAGGIATNGNLINSSGSLSGYGIYLNSSNRASGYGGTSMLSADAGSGTFNKKNGFDASGFGCGGGGACIYADTGSYYGGSGYQGVVIIWEYA